MRILIVEDEMLLANRLQKLLLEAEPHAIIAAITQSVEETVDWLSNNPGPDLIMMDIELADGQSFDIFRITDVAAAVIFTTAYDEYAIRAFKVNSIDYLLKPIKKEELVAAIDKYKSRLALPAQVRLEMVLAEIQKMNQPAGYRNRFLIRQAQKLVSIETETVAYIFSDNGYSYIRTFQNQKYILDYTLDELEQTLSPKQFFRVNRQYILNSKSVTAIHPWFNQKLKVACTPVTEEHIVISRDKANAFKEWMGE